MECPLNDFLVIPPVCAGGDFIVIGWSVDRLVDFREQGFDPYRTHHQLIGI